MEDLKYIVIIAGGFLYFVPSIIATMRDHRQAAAIRLLNLLAGWTVVGWIACYVWAYMDGEKSRK